MSYWDALPERYRVILCDIWGVVHDGVRLYPCAAQRLTEWRGEGRSVILITNAPRTAEAVEQQLARIGLPSDAWNGIATSGEAGIAALLKLGEPVGFVGTVADRDILEGRGVRIAEAEPFADLACTGIEEERPDVAQYRADLERWAANGVTMHCLNPDRVVVRGGVPEPCAGAIADVYEDLGGKVCWYGKPHGTIYLHAMHLAGNPPREDVLAVGDGLQTDILGAARMGFDAVFVRGGINEGRPFPSDFAPSNGLGEWQPVAIVDGLA
jgi:HAD superfamily hydrolase (TIGR01459 family)